MSINVNSIAWGWYVGHVLKYEGGLSNDPNDTAASCAPFPGAYHTNKGVTYCTFLSLGPSLGVTPPTYDKFKKLTDQEIGRFLFHYYTDIKGSQFYDSVALSMTEAAWGSGADRAIKHLQDSLTALGRPVTRDGIIGPETITAARQVTEAALYKEYWRQRQAFINSLTAQPKYAIYKNGWQNRIKDFLSIIKPAGSAGGMLILALAAVFF